MSQSRVSTTRPQPPLAGSGPRTASAREAGLAMIRRVNRWLIAGAVAAAGMFSLLAAHAFHGRSLNTSASSASQAASQSGASQSPSSTSGSGAGLQAPAQAPSPAPAAPAPVVSGGS
jgi:hypothetical protein